MCALTGPQRTATSEPIPDIEDAIEPAQPEPAQPEPAQPEPAEPAAVQAGTKAVDSLERLWRKPGL